MEVSSPQLAQAIAAARVALAEAFVLRVGQTLQAVVAGKEADGLTLLRIGEQTVKAALPEALPPGTMLQLEVKSAGAAPQLAIVVQKLPQGAAGLPSSPIEPRAVMPTAPQAARPVAARQVTAPQNVEAPPPFARAVSQIESTPVAATRPAAEGRPLPVAPTPEVGRSTVQEAIPAVIGARAAVADPAPPTLELPRIASSAGGAASSPSVAAPAGASVPVAAAQPASVAVVRLASSAARPAPASAAQVSTGVEMVSAMPGPAAATRALAAVERAAARPPAIPAGPGPAAAEPELTHPLLVAQVAPRPQATAAELPRPVAVSNAVPPAAAPAPAPLPTTRQAALSQMLPEALARQDSAGPLLQSLATLLQKPATLPEPVLRAALSVLAQRIVAPDGKVQPADLERAILRSGLGLEAALARGEAPVPLDAKAGLLALRAALTKWLGEAPASVAQSRETAPPPLRGLPLRAPELNPAPLPDTPREALRAVHGQADAAVSRLKLMQMSSLPDADPGRPATAALRLDLPLLIGHELVMAQLQVPRDGSRRETERKRGWTMRFALNYSATGEVGAEVGLLGKAVNVALWAAEPATKEAMQAALPELGAALEAIGLKPGLLRIRHGVPEPGKPASGRLLDSVS